MKKSLKHIRLAPQLYEELLRRIWCGDYPAGTQLESVSKLTELLGVGKHSVEAAVDMLAADGYLKKHPGRAPLIVMPQRKGVLHLAATGMNTSGELQMYYEKSPRRYLFKDSVLRALRKNNCHCTSIYDRQTLQKALPVLDGIVHFQFLDKPHNPAPQVGLPVLTVKNMLEEVLQPNTVYTDRDQAVEKTAYYMISYGVKSVLSLQRGNDVLHNEREKLLQKIMDGFGRSDLFYHTAITQGVGEKHAAAPLKAFLEKDPRRPIGVLAQGDLLARGCAQTALECGLQLKKDIIIVGCTGLPEAASWHPAVSSLTSPFASLGKCAAESVIKLIRSKQDLEPQIIYGQLIIRET